MYHFVKRIMITATLGLAIGGFANAQSQQVGLPNIQKLTNNAMKLSLGIGAASAGAAVVGLVIKHHHHKKQSEASTSAKGRPSDSLTTAPVSSFAPADSRPALQTP